MSYREIKNETTVSLEDEDEEERNLVDGDMKYKGKKNIKEQRHYTYRDCEYYIHPP